MYSHSHRVSRTEDPCPMLNQCQQVSPGKMGFQSFINIFCLHWKMNHQYYLIPPVECRLDLSSNNVTWTSGTFAYLSITVKVLIRLFETVESQNDQRECVVRHLNDEFHWWLMSTWWEISVWASHWSVVLSLRLLGMKTENRFWLRLNLFGSYGLHQWQILWLCKKWLLFVFWKHLIESQTLDPPSPALSLVTRDIYSCKASPTWCIYGHSSYNESCSQQDILARYLSIKRPKWVTAMIRLFAPSCLIRSN